MFNSPSTTFSYNESPSRPVRRTTSCNFLFNPSRVCKSVAICFASSSFVLTRKPAFTRSVEYILSAFFTRGSVAYICLQVLMIAIRSRSDFSFWYSATMDCCATGAAVVSASAEGGLKKALILDLNEGISSSEDVLYHAFQFRKILFHRAHNDCIAATVRCFQKLAIKNRVRQRDDQRVFISAFHSHVAHLTLGFRCHLAGDRSKPETIHRKEQPPACVAGPVFPDRVLPGFFLHDLPPVIRHGLNGNQRLLAIIIQTLCNHLRRNNPLETSFHLISILVVDVDESFLHSTKCLFYCSTNGIVIAVRPICHACGVSPSCAEYHKSKPVAVRTIELRYKLSSHPPVAVVRSVDNPVLKLIPSVDLPMINL